MSLIDGRRRDGSETRHERPRSVCAVCETESLYIYSSNESRVWPEPAQPTMLKVRMIMVHTHARYCDASRGEHMIKRRRERDRRDAMPPQVSRPAPGATQRPAAHTRKGTSIESRIRKRQQPVSKGVARSYALRHFSSALCATPHSLSLSHSLTLSFWLHSSASRSTPHT